MKYLLLTLLILTSIVFAQKDRRTKKEILEQIVDSELKYIKTKKIDGKEFVGIYFMDKRERSYFEDIGIKYIDKIGLYYLGDVSKANYRKIRMNKLLDWVKLAHREGDDARDLNPVPLKPSKPEREKKENNRNNRLQFE